MKKFLFIALAVMTLSACGPASYEDHSDKYSVMPPELKGCKVYVINSADGGYLKALYCANKNTQSITYPEGKTQTSSVVVTDTVNVPAPPSDTLGSKTEFPAVLVTDGPTTTKIQCKIMSGLPVCFVEKKP